MSFFATPKGRKARFERTPIANGMQVEVRGRDSLTSVVSHLGQHSKAIGWSEGQCDGSRGQNRPATLLLIVTCCLGERD